MREKGPAHIHLFGDKYEARKLIGIGYKYLGFLKADMRFNDLMHGVRTVNAADGVVYKVRSIMGALGVAIDSISIYAPPGYGVFRSTEIDFCTGFIVELYKQETAKEIVPPYEPTLDVYFKEYVPDSSPKTEIGWVLLFADVYNTTGSDSVGLYGAVRLDNFNGYDGLIENTSEHYVTDVLRGAYESYLWQLSWGVSEDWVTTTITLWDDPGRTYMLHPFYPMINGFGDAIEYGDPSEDAEKYANAWNGTRMDGLPADSALIFAMRNQRQMVSFAGARLADDQSEGAYTMFIPEDRLDHAGTIFALPNKYEIKFTDEDTKDNFFSTSEGVTEGLLVGHPDVVFNSPSPPPGYVVMNPIPARTANVYRSHEFKSDWEAIKPKGDIKPQDYIVQIRSWDELPFSYEKEDVLTKSMLEDIYELKIHFYGSKQPPMVFRYDASKYDIAIHVGSVNPNYKYGDTGHLFTLKERENYYVQLTEECDTYFGTPEPAGPSAFRDLSEAIAEFEGNVKE